MGEAGEKSTIATAYDDWANTYDVNENRTRDLAGVVLRTIDLPIAGRRVVEVGCGTGRNTVWLAEQAAELVAIDFSEEMLARAKARVTGKQVRFVQHDVCRRWPISNESADLVIAILILEHVEKLEVVFAEAARVLAPGGKLFLCELHPTRQLLGGQAQFDNATGERQLVTAFIHDVSEYVNTGLRVGLAVEQLGEWRDEDAARTTPPRLLSILFKKSK
jgi:ubiquinone/menaquinone biosynthesis C-methylase UbiE